MLHKYCIYIWIVIVIFICLFNLYKINNLKKDRKSNEYYNYKYNIFKTPNPGYGKIVSVDDNGNLNSFEFPKGIIVAWSGDIARIPDGWTICNGQNGAPDLRGRFILGANPNSNKNSSFMINEQGASGGKEKALLKHKHQYFQSVSDGDDWSGGGYELTYPNGGNKTWVKTMDQGESDGNADRADFRATPDTSEIGDENSMPPYYSLAYIMKL